MSMNINITFEKDEHPACFGKDCEGEHWQQNIHMRTENFTLVIVENSKEWEILKKLLIDFDKKLPEGVKKLLKASQECRCEEKFYIQKMMIELNNGVMKCEHNSVKK